MKTLVRLFTTFLILLAFSAVSFSQNITLTQSSESGIYKKGENIQVFVELKDLDCDSLPVKIYKNFSSEFTLKKVKFSGDKTVIFEGSFNEPTSMIFEVLLVGIYGSTGFVVEPEKFQPGTSRPQDFDEYWNAEKAALHSLPMEIKSVRVDNIEAGFSCSDVELNCTGPKPARGYFAKPDSALSKSLPIVLFVRAAGVKGDWCQSKPKDAMNYAKMGNGALAFDLNAHGMLNGQPQEYYDDQEKGELKNYWEIGMENRDECYFRGMYLRLLRTLDFLTAQPGWDGKRIIVIGESQGGGQALVAAGLDHRVTAVVATVPAMCDFGAKLHGGIGGWPNPFKYFGNKEKMLETLPYFDAAHILKNCNATLVTEIGLIDRTCPATAIYAALNQAKGEKIIFTVPYRSHHVEQKQFQKIWDDSVYKPKMDFIAEFLK